MIWILALGIFGIFYAIIGYPAALWIVARAHSRRIIKSDIRPSVNFILPVHNEANGILAKIENLQALDYPNDLMQIIVASDGSTDATCDLCRRIDGVDVIELPERRGKSAAINAALQRATGDVIALTDVAAMLEPNALSSAVSCLADPDVGCVSSEDVVIGKGGVAAGEGLYSRLDTLARRLESRVASATGMSGSFYIVRRDLCPPFPLEAANDMFTALYCVRSGYLAVVDESSRVRIAAQPKAGSELRRKTRTMVTGLRAIALFPMLLNPIKCGLFSVCLWGHKILRYCLPIFAILILIGSATISLELLAIELVLIVLSVAKLHPRLGNYLPGALSTPAFFCLSLAATILAGYEFVMGKNYTTWQPTQRSAI